MFQIMEAIKAVTENHFFEAKREARFFSFFVHAARCNQDGQDKSPCMAGVLAAHDRHACSVLN